MNDQLSAPSESAEFTIGEDDLAKDLGLSREQLRKLRGKEGVDWGRGPNGRIGWAAQAKTELLKSISPVPPDAPVPAPPPKIETLTVSRKRVPNPRLVLGVRETGETVKVWLGGRAELFHHPMKILAQAGQNDLWHWEGNPDNPKAGRRLPRRKGRW